MDFYGGWKGSFGDFGVDVGTIYYAYPGGTKFHGVVGLPGHQQLGGLPRR